MGKDNLESLKAGLMIIKAECKCHDLLPSFFHSDLLASKIGSATFCCPFFWKRTAKSREAFFVLQKDVKKSPKRCQKVSNLFWTPKGSRAKKSAKSRGTCVHLKHLSGKLWGFEKTHHKAQFRHCLIRHLM